jgi:hypothetical protein
MVCGAHRSSQWLIGRLMPGGYPYECECNLSRDPPSGSADSATVRLVTIQEPEVSYYGSVPIGTTIVVAAVEHSGRSYQRRIEGLPEHPKGLQVACKPYSPPSLPGEWTWAGLAQAEPVCPTNPAYSQFVRVGSWVRVA